MLKWLNKSFHTKYTKVQHYCDVQKICANQTSKASKKKPIKTGNWKVWSLRSCMLAGRLKPPPSARLRPFEMCGQSKQAVRGSEGARDWWPPSFTKKWGWPSGLTRKLKAPAEPGAALTTSGSVVGSGPSTGRFLPERLRGERQREVSQQRWAQRWFNF